MSREAGTPPHRPTYNVCLSNVQIQRIITVVFPAHHTERIEQLESGKSFNNRIYFIDLKSDGSDVVTRPIVLKVVGHYFDHRKIENEVGSLLLLDRYCANVPAPKVYAWSPNGRAVETIHGLSPKTTEIEADPGSDHGWILMSRLPGRSITETDLDGEQRVQLLTQIANYVHMWRTLMPLPSHFGNIKYLTSDKPKENTQVFTNLTLTRSFCLGGLILCTYYSPAPLASSLEYYTRCAQDQMERITQNRLFAAVREDLTPLSAKLLSIMPQLPILQSERPARFTHFDLSPRNILVSETDPSVVTGMLDFEFAGFFQEEEEFINAQIRQSTDWREQDWRVLMKELARLGESIPPTEDIDKKFCTNELHWKQLVTLTQVIDNIAPWWIQEGAYSSDELASELKRAVAIVRAKLGDLQSLLHDTEPYRISISP